MRVIWLCLPLLFAPVGCASIATGFAADALSGAGGSFGRDEDPELVEQAVPFALKTMEALLDSQPEHVGLLTALASGFAQYGYAFVQQDADEIRGRDLAAGRALEARARKLYRRALRYALRGLEVDHQGFSATVKTNPDRALTELETEDVPLLYWTAASWGLLISSSKNDPEVLADLPLVEQLARRALLLDESFQRGAIHELMINLETSKSNGSLDEAKKHFERALVLSSGARAAPYVTYAEKVCVKTQDRKTFLTQLDQALAVALDKSPDDRLANVLMQRRAERLKSSVDDLFLEEGDSE
ncbi:MAG: hypothetical protein HY791_29885 [Deltaproteobacteria bacterium]|nr:hypothetical protein [Deltaproteobacteria bacterium]